MFTEKMKWGNKEILFMSMAIFALSILGVTGCDNSIDSFGEEKGGFSVYGYLSVSDEMQFIRVKDLTTPLIPDSTKELEATVRLKNLSTGRTEQLKDSVIIFNDIYTHNFYTTTPVRSATEYRVIVEGNDGRTTEATATTPEITQTNVRPDSGDCNSTIYVSFRNVPGIAHIQAEIGFTLEGEQVWVSWPLSSTSSDSPLLSFVPAEVVGQRLDREVEPRYRCTLLDERKWGVAYLHLGPDWPFDEEGDPLESVSVENGLGSFGGLYRDTLTSIRVDTTIAPPL